MYRGTVLVTLVRSLTKSCYFDFIGVKNKSDVRDVKEIARSHTAGNGGPYIGPRVCLVIHYS